VNIEETGSGLAIMLDVDGLAPAAPGTFYQAWMKGDESSGQVVLTADIGAQADS